LNRYLSILVRPHSRASQAPSHVNRSKMESTVGKVSEVKSETVTLGHVTLSTVGSQPSTASNLVVPGGWAMESSCGQLQHRSHTRQDKGTRQRHKPKPATSHQCFGELGIAGRAWTACDHRKARSHVRGRSGMAREWGGGRWLARGLELCVALWSGVWAKSCGLRAASRSCKAEAGCNMAATLGTHAYASSRCRFPSNWCRQPLLMARNVCEDRRKSREEALPNQ